MSEYHGLSVKAKSAWYVTSFFIQPTVDKFQADVKINLNQKENWRYKLVSEEKEQSNTPSNPFIFSLVIHNSSV